jgi:hypothetical protein
MNCARHESLSQLQYALVEMHNLLPKLLFKVNSALLEIKEEKFGYMFVNCCRLYDVTVVNDVFQRLKELTVRVEPEILQFTLEFFRSNISSLFDDTADRYASIFCCM